MTVTATATIPQRLDIDSRYTWNLTDLFGTDQDWETTYQSVQSRLGSAAVYAGTLGQSPERLCGCLKLRSELTELTARLYQYAHLNRDSDTRVSRYQEMTDRAAMLSSQVAATFAFIEPELLEIPEAKLLAMAAEFDPPDHYDFYIRELIRSRAHVRSHEVEELLAQSMMIARGPDTAFSMLDDADLVYPMVTDEQGNQVRLTKQRFARLLEARSQAVRREAHNAFYSAYKDHVNTIGATLGTSVAGDLFYTRARRYGTCLERALDNDNIPVSVYHALIKTTEEHLDTLHAYIRLRKRLLKLEAIFPFDMACPLFPDYDYEVTYDDAVKQVIESVAPLGEEYRQIVRGAFTSRWVDVFEVQGKAGGAYSYGTYPTHPYILMNYNNTVDNLFTLAHELGHALHSFHTNRTQPFPKAHYSTFVAEVASTLNEGLLWHMLMKRENDPMRRLYLLNRYMDNTFGTFFHQVLYATFELAIHEQVEAGQALSPDWMTTRWSALTSQYYGPAITMDEYSPLKWSRIPHFYNMFYVYQYATSYAASQMILERIMAGEADAVPRYLQLLSAGGSDYPIELLKRCGVDMTSPEPVLATIRLFRQQVDEVDRLTR